MKLKTKLVMACLIVAITIAGAWMYSPIRPVRVLATIPAHQQGIFSLAFTPDGETLATASADHTIKLWDVETKRERTVLRGHTDYVCAVAISHDGKLLASGGEDRNVKLWNLATLKEIASLNGHTKRITSLAFSPDNRILVSAGWDGKVRVWDVIKKAFLFELAEGTHGEVAISCDGSTLGITNNKGVMLWDLKVSKLLIQLIGDGHLSFGHALAFSPDGKRLAWSNYSMIKIHDTDNGRELANFRDPTTTTFPALAFTSDGKYVLAGDSSGKVQVLETSSGRRVYVRQKHRACVSALVFPAKGKWFATGNGPTGFDDKDVPGEVVLWEIDTNQFNHK